MTTNTDRVRSFISAWEARDLAAILARLAPDARYVNVGMSDTSGREAIGVSVAPFLSASSEVSWSVTHIAETPAGVVLTERVDVFVVGGKTLTIPVMGVFEFEGELIRAWRDYFDVAGFQAQMA